MQQQCRDKGVSYRYVELYADYCEAIWDEGYRIFNDVAGDVCEYPLARHLELFAVGLGSELVVRYVLSGNKQNFSGTLAEFAFCELEL